MVSDRRTRSRLPDLPTVDVQIGESHYPATAVLLAGHSASVVMDRVPAARRDAVRLRLGWCDGTETTLSARVRSVHSNGQVAHFDVEGVAGAWQSFVAFLGSRAPA